jgi:RNA polymerase sigma-70 factor (ECF subfamily)
MTAKASLDPKLRTAFGEREATYPGDAALVDAIVRGDARAAGVLYDRLRPVVDHALRRVLHNRPDDFDDLMQSTFERIVRSLAQDRFDGRSQLTTWAAAIAGHVAMDALRHRYRERRWITATDVEAVEHPPSNAYTSEKRLEARSEIRRLHRILVRMKPNLADTLILHDVLGHEVAEIASIAGAGISATQSRLLRARKELLRRARAVVPREGHQP